MPAVGPAGRPPEPAVARGPLPPAVLATAAALGSSSAATAGYAFNPYWNPDAHVSLVPQTVT